VSCLFSLSLTTPITDLEFIARRFRVPGVLVEMTGLVYRFIFFCLILPTPCARLSYPGWGIRVLLRASAPLPHFLRRCSCIHSRSRKIFLSVSSLEAIQVILLCRGSFMRVEESGMPHSSFSIWQLLLPLFFFNHFGGTGGETTFPA